MQKKAGRCFVALDMSMRLEVVGRSRQRRGVSNERQVPINALQDACPPLLSANVMLYLSLQGICNVLMLIIIDDLFPE